MRGHGVEEFVRDEDGRSRGDRVDGLVPLHGSTVEPAHAAVHGRPPQIFGRRAPLRVRARGVVRARVPRLAREWVFRYPDVREDARAVADVVRRLGVGVSPRAFVPVSATFGVASEFLSLHLSKFGRYLDQVHGDGVGEIFEHGGAAKEVGHERASPRAEFDEADVRGFAHLRPLPRGPRSDELAEHLAHLGGRDEVAADAEDVAGHVVAELGVGENLLHVLGDGDGAAAELDDAREVRLEAREVGGGIVARTVRLFDGAEETGAIDGHLERAAGAAVGVDDVLAAVAAPSGGDDRGAAGGEAAASARGSDTNFEKRGSVVGPRRERRGRRRARAPARGGARDACLATPHRRHRRASQPPKPAHRARRDATTKRRLGADVLADIESRARGEGLPALRLNKTWASAIRLTGRPVVLDSTREPRTRARRFEAFEILLVGPWSVIPVDPFVRLFCLCGSDPSLLIWRGIFPGEKAPFPTTSQGGKGSGRRGAQRRTPRLARRVRT